jgi:hypothetical protein
MTCKKIDWEKYVGLTTDGTTALKGKMKELSGLAKAPDLQNTLNEVMKNFNHMKTCALNTCFFKTLCEEMGSDHTHLLLHTEIHWL